MDLYFLSHFDEVLWYLLDDSFEIEIRKRGRLGRREKGIESIDWGVLVHGVWFDARAVFGGTSGSCPFILERVF